MDAPLRTAPSGITPDFENPPFLGLPVLVTAGICLFLVFLFTAVRIYATVYVLKKWKLDDYVYCFSCTAGVAFIAFEISIVLSKPIGYHAWNVRESDVTKSSLMHLLAFSITLGPVLWLLKLSLFCFVLRHFGSVRWVKNCVYIGIIVLGLVFSGYTIIVTMSCGPLPGSDTVSYLNGVNRMQCSSPEGVTAVFSIITGTFNGIGDLYLIVISMPLVSSLRLSTKQMYGVYLIQLCGALVCLCSLMGVYYRYKSWQSTDLTGGQIPLYVVLALEMAIGLMIPCMPSFATIWRYYTDPNINDTGNLTTPNMRGVSSLSFSSPLILSQPESRATWRKTHLSIEEIPYRKTSSEYNQYSIRTPLPVHIQRMKALPSTPLPYPYTKSAPQSPTTPKSCRSMQLPIMFSHY
ncbi:hypothetical protein K505DRAFT_81205 [Melanomma pulvis-pyrius CBS 109.77]|uniref:Rhodopsin domain-containing protein n=1 Tax=Melanomma pulvis-pyrius CBS 109.77 TaxID=1314802 RepID=A0A6A6X2A5_9PLEO|nr:hypothetical protein K505DRAFT_81205 [Melanomma pulvis-pyrius CBS 109.77]